LLKPSNARYPTITVQEGQDFLIWDRDMVFAPTGSFVS